MFNPCTPLSDRKHRRSFDSNSVAPNRRTICIAAAGADGLVPTLRAVKYDFKNGSTLPQSMISNVAAVFGGPPVAGCEGGNESPELSWSDAPRGTRRFAIVMFDADASFFHWSMYNSPS